MDKASFLFEIPNIFAGLKHRFAGIKRRILSQPGDLYAQRQIAMGTQLPPGGEPPIVSQRTCHVCGFQLLEVSSSVATGGWHLEACPFECAKGLKSSALIKWLADLEECSTYNRIEPVVISSTPGRD